MEKYILHTSKSNLFEPLKNYSYHVWSDWNKNGRSRSILVLFQFFLVVAVPRFDFKYESKLCSSRSILSYGIWNLEQSFHFLWNDWEWSREDLVLYRVKQKYCDLLQIEAKNSDRCWSCYVHIKVWKPWCFSDTHTLCEINSDHFTVTKIAI